MYCLEPLIAHASPLLGLNILVVSRTEPPTQNQFETRQSAAYLECSGPARYHAGGERGGISEQQTAPRTTRVEKELAPLLLQTRAQKVIIAADNT